MASPISPSTHDIEHDEQDKQVRNSEPVDIKAITDDLVESFNYIMILAESVAKLPKGASYNVAEPGSESSRNIGKRDVRSLKAAFTKQLRDLGKYSSNVRRRPNKVTRERRPGTGLSNPMYVNENLSQFFANASLGHAYVRVVQDGEEHWQDQGDLNQFLQLLTQNGITSSALLTPLFSIYARVNNMQYSDNRQFLKATDDMLTYFRETFDYLTNEDQNKPRTRKQKVKDETTGKTTEQNVQEQPFDPSRFRYSRFQSIVMRNRKQTQDLSEDEKLVLADPQVRQRLADEQQLVSDTLRYYREQAAAQEGTSRRRGGKAKK